MKKIATIAWFLLLAAAAWQAMSGYNQLPDRIVTHFDMQGRPNGWMDKGFFYLFYCGLVVFVNAVPFLALSASARSAPHKMNLPRKDYWLANDERRAEALSISKVMSVGVVCGLTVLFMTIFHIILDHALAAKSGPVPPQPVDAKTFLFLLGPFAAILTVSIGIGMYALRSIPLRRGAGPPPESLKDKWMWNRKMLEIWTSSSVVFAFVLFGVSVPSRGYDALYFLLIALVGPVLWLTFGVAGKRVQRLKDEMAGSGGEMAESLIVSGNIQAPGVVVLKEDEIVLVPIAGKRHTVPLASILSVRRTRNMYGKGFVWKRVFILGVPGFPRLAFAVSEPVARRWGARIVPRR